MIALIDIKTPAGKSLEGFPTEINMEISGVYGYHIGLDKDGGYYANVAPLIMNKICNLHPGDTITITIKE